LCWIGYASRYIYRLRESAIGLVCVGSDMLLDIYIDQERESYRICLCCLCVVSVLCVTLRLSFPCLAIFGGEKGEKKERVSSSRRSK
jgi:hypothetical protein